MGRERAEPGLKCGRAVPLVALDAKGRVHRLVLVSCDAASFGRDAGLLADAGYARRSSVRVDLFPHTPRVELVSRFDKMWS